MKRNPRWPRVVAVLAVIMCFFVGVQILGSHNDGYRFAVKFIRESPTVAKQLGNVTSTHLALMGYGFSSSGPEAHGKFRVHVIGTRAAGEVYLNVEKSVGVWRVIKGNLVLASGATIPLTDNRGMARQRK
jgi:hypothetical protein